MKNFDYKIAVIAALVIVIVALVYNQQRNESLGAKIGNDISHAANNIKDDVKGAQ